jgi:hypothetical protein
MKKKMIIVGTDDGIILDVSRCAIFDENELSEADQTLLNFGTESDALSVSNRHGTKLSDILEGCGYGDLHYGNCLALTPITLQQEFEEIPEMIGDVDHIEGAQEIKKILEWGAHLNKNQFDLLSSYILQDDELWIHWRTAVVTALDWMYAEYNNTESDES